VGVAPTGQHHCIGLSESYGTQPFHDEDLQKATAEINKIVLGVLTENKGKNDRSLHVVLAKHGPMLVWARAMVMEVDDIMDLAAD
jgi:hypothetical protein